MPRRKGARKSVLPWVLTLGMLAGVGTLAMMWAGGLPDLGPSLTLEPEDPGRMSAIPTPSDRVRVEVLNGGGVPGIAAAGRDRLRDEGFDVVYFGNASSFGLESSRVLDRTGKAGAATEVAGSLGIAEIHSEPDTTLLVDVTVLLGTDWGPTVQGANPGVGGGERESDEGEVRVWWDLGRFVDLLNALR
jgi:hypothetical protein